MPVLVLVNNAGVSADDLTPSLGDERVGPVIDTEPDRRLPRSRAAALRADAARPLGRIVNIASVVGLRANPGQANYAAAKAGLIALTKTAAVEVARRGVTVNAVAPGLIETDMTADVSTGAARGDSGAGAPARRRRSRHACASSSPTQAGYVTGAVLSVDGGLAA